MRRKFLIRFILLLAVYFYGSAFAQEITVAEAFVAIPAEQIMYSRGERETYLESALVDQPNGYIKYRARDNSENFEFAIFKRHDQSYLAAISWGPGDCIDYAPETCQSDLRFFKQTNAGWQPLGVSPLPSKFKKRLVYQLPRVGKTIVVKTRRGVVIEKYTFNGNIFVK